MNYLITILVLIILGLGWIIYKTYQRSERDGVEILALQKEAEEYRELGAGLAEYNLKVRERREKIRGRILGLFGAGGVISNREVAGKVGISSVSAFRYLDELEKSGKLKQVGKKGRSVVYSLK